MSDDIDAMMAVGLLHTVRECAHRLYGEIQTYPCDDVKRMAAENERLREEIKQSRQTCEFWKVNHLAGNDEIERLRRRVQRYREAWGNEKRRFTEAMAVIEGDNE